MIAARQVANADLSGKSQSNSLEFATRFYPHHGRNADMGRSAKASDVFH
jgi:hypothetical protein